VEVVVVVVEGGLEGEDSTAIPSRKCDVSTCTGSAAACSGVRCAWATTRAV